MDLTLKRLLSRPQSKNGLTIVSSVIATVAVLGLARISLNRPHKKVIASPRKTQLPKLSKEEQDDLPYVPDAYPGARDIITSYGSMRVYEFGPETGRKVLLIHGVSTPSISLSGIARGLIAKGCRVMLFDLWGRGYSDMIDLPLDSRLYTTQILLAITSSNLAWTPGGFSILGYSLGGGIAVDFAADFPDLVQRIAILAPGGLIRPHYFSWSNRLLYSGFIPDMIVEWIVRRRLGGGEEAEKPVSEAKTGDQDHPTTTDELKGNRDPVFESAVLHTRKPGITIGHAIQWQMNHHEGFIKSFVSSMRHSSISERQETWAKLSKREDKLLIIAGTTDPVIVAPELREDAEQAVGKENVEWKTVTGGHEFPVTHANEVVGMVCESWSI